MKYGPYFFLLLVLVLGSCRKDHILKDTGISLKLSADTVKFDTVFSRFDTLHAPLSTTRTVKVYNPYKNAVETSVRLAGGAASVYRINIDGTPASSIDNYKLAGGDSMYIFIQVTPRITTQANPLFVEDSILITTNGHQQKIHLVAWGQDAHYFFQDTIKTDAVWNDKTKPYVIWDYLLVAPGVKLTIEEGVKICNHVGSDFNVMGTLEVNGTEKNPVVFQGDRLERNLDDVPNQWLGIHFWPGAKDNVIRNAIIKNGVTGVRVDYLPANSNPNLIMNNTLIRTMSSSCLSSYSARVQCVNCVFIEAGQLCVYGQYGGDYEFIYCTIGNPHCINFQSNYPACYLGNADYEITDANGNVISKTPSFMKYKLVNSIIYGESTNEEELGIYDGGRPANVTLQVIDHCQIKTKIQGLGINGNIINTDPKFKDRCKYNYELDTLAPAVNKALPLTGVVDFDIKGTPRDNTPCIGAYERN